MSFHDLLNGLLSELDIPYFEGSPELSDSTPEAFIFYNVYDVPALRGCGEEFLTTYYVTVNVYTTGENKAQTADNIGTALTTLLTENGFVRQSGTYGLTDDFPEYYHRIIEFNYNREI